MIRVGFLLLLYIAAVTASAPAPAAPANPTCVTTFKPATNFDLAKFSVTWYEMLQITPEGEEKCVSETYTTNPADKTLSVTRLWADTANKPQKASGTAKTSGTKTTDAKLTVAIGKKSTEYTIFHVNYESAYGAYACIDKKPQIFVFSRTRKVDDSALKDINSAITAAGLNPKLLKPSPRTDCPAGC